MLLVAGDCYSCHSVFSATMSFSVGHILRVVNPIQNSEWEPLSLICNSYSLPTVHCNWIINRCSVFVQT